MSRVIFNRRRSSDLLVIASDLLVIAVTFLNDVLTYIHTKRLKDFNIKIKGN